MSNDVHQVGTEDIRGVESTHYRASLDLSKSIDESNVPEGLRDSMEEFTKMFGDIPADVWIDADGRMRRERLVIDFGKVFGGVDAADGSRDAAGVMTEQLDFYDFGTPVNVEAPPADQVRSLSDQFADLGSGFQEQAA